MCDNDQRAPLPQTDRAMRCASQNLMNCCTAVGTSCTSPEQIEVMELEVYGRTTRCDPQARPLASFVDNTIDLPWRNFLSPGFGAKFQMEVGPGASKPYKRWSKCTMKK